MDYDASLKVLKIIKCSKYMYVKSYQKNLNGPYKENLSYDDPTF
jgi:hypothetical protein